MGLPDYVALQRDYVEHGWPVRVSTALFAGWKPPVKAADDIYQPEDLAAFLAAYPGAEKVAPPTE